MTPPSRCCTILFCPVATNTPEATTAPAIGAMLPQTPNPMTAAARIRMPAMVGSRVERGSEACHAGSTLPTGITPLALRRIMARLRLPSVQDRRPAAIRFAAGQQRNDVVAIAERLDRAALQHHDLVDAAQQG